jgi:hypothetical protein
MEEEKAQKLVDTLSKLRKSAGLGVSTHFNFGGASELIQFKKDDAGNVFREDGLPVNGLYSGFVREGTYNPETSAQIKYGDGRKIKRNFDDIDSMSDSKTGKRTKKNESKKSKKSKEERKAEKKAAKLEAKRAAKKAEKLELKKKQKLEAKLLKKTESISESSSSIAKTNEEGSTADVIKKSKKKGEKKKEEIDNEGNTPIQSAKSNDATVRLTDDKKQKKEKKMKKEKKSKS